MYIREGRGIHVASTDKRIDGFWSDNVLNGLGRIIESGFMHKGFYKDGKRDGYGIEKSIGGNSYHGEFKADKKYGNGKYVCTSSGTVYDGEWFNNKKHGLGKYNWPNGNEYFGEWINDERKG